MQGATVTAHYRLTDSYAIGGPMVARPELGEGWDFEDEAEMQDRYPRLTARFS
jgi:hypothetical protein